MDKQIIMFGHTKIQIFHQYKSPILIKNIDINKIVVTNKVSFDKNGFKYFISYKYAKIIDFYAFCFQK